MTLLRRKLKYNLKNALNGEWYDGSRSRYRNRIFTILSNPFDDKAKDAD
jgi:hypothetical protein